MKINPCVICATYDEKENQTPRIKYPSFYHRERKSYEASCSACGYHQIEIYRNLERAIKGWNEANIPLSIRANERFNYINRRMRELMNLDEPEDYVTINNSLVTIGNFFERHLQKEAKEKEKQNED